MQIAVISIRPDVLAETMAHVRHFMPWVDRWLVVTPDRLTSQFDLDGVTTVLSDEEVTGLTSDQLQGLDHASRDVLIRGRLMARDEVDDELLVSDDDYRPLKPVEADAFRADGRIRCHYFYDLDAWPGLDTPYDDGLHNTPRAASYLGIERPRLQLPHAAAGPRRRTGTRHGRSAHACSPTCRCASGRVYFNVARDRHPDDYCDPEPFRTLCWPQYPNEWPWWVRPDEYVFENFYPGLYLPGHLFDGIPTSIDPEHVERHSLEKIVRWASFDRHAARPRLPRRHREPVDGRLPDAQGELRRVAPAPAGLPLRVARRTPADHRAPGDGGPPRG